MPNRSDTQPEDRLQVRCATASPDAVRDDGDLAGYQMAFYELAKIMGIGARVAAPGHVWRTEMLPRLLATLATPPTAGKVK